MRDKERIKKSIIENIYKCGGTADMNDATDHIKTDTYTNIQVCLLDLVREGRVIAEIRKGKRKPDGYLEITREYFHLPLKEKIAIKRYTK